MKDLIQLHVYMKTHCSNKGHLVEHFRKRGDTLLVVERANGAEVKRFSVRLQPKEDPSLAGTMIVTEVTKKESEKFWEENMKKPLILFSRLVLQLVHWGEGWLREVFLESPREVYEWLEIQAAKHEDSQLREIVL